MPSIQALEERREYVLEQMRQIRSMRRGSISEQFLKTKRHGVTKRCGPYYLISRRINGKTKSQRLKPGEQLEQARRDVQRHQRFVELCREFEELTEQLGEAERAVGPEKKRRRSPSSKTARSISS
jgi:hypothetical protein